MTEPTRPGGAYGSGNVVNVGTNAGVFAVGDHAQATQVNQGTDAEAAIARLELALQHLTAAAAAQLGGEQAEQVGADADRVIEEARRKWPDWDRITQLIGRITTRVGAVAGLLEAVSQIKGLIEALPH